MNPAIILAGALALLGGGAGLYAYARDNGWIGAPPAAPVGDGSAPIIDLSVSDPDAPTISSDNLTALNLNATTSAMGGTVSLAQGAYEAGVEMNGITAAAQKQINQNINSAMASAAAAAAAAAAQAKAGKAPPPPASSAPSFSLGVI